VPGEVVSRDQLRVALWPDTIHVDFERSLNSAMRKLRVALHEEAGHPRYVQTLQGHGYRFIAPVQQSSDTALSAAEPSAVVGPPSVCVPRRYQLILAVGVVTTSVIVVAFTFWSASRASRPAVAIRTAGSMAATRVMGTTHGRARDAFGEGQAINGYRLSELSRAIENFEAAVQLDPGFASAWAALARARASRALLDGRDRLELRLARSEAKQALAFDHTLADAHLALGQVHFALDEDPARAEIDLRQARALGASSGRDLFWLLWVLKVEGRTASALRVVTEALATEANNVELHAWRGLLLHDAKRYDEERAELQRALAIDEDSWMAMLQMGLSYSRRREYDRALPALQRAVALSDGSSQTRTWLDRISAEARDLASAEQTPHQRREIGPTRGETPSKAVPIEYYLGPRRTRPAR
jgi:tetratricopeptide (TPR) repeat protein